MCIQLHTVCKITHHVWNKNYIHDYTGVCRVQYGKNSSHLKNFTLTLLVALVTIIRYRVPQKKVGLVENRLWQILMLIVRNPEAILDKSI